MKILNLTHIELHTFHKALFTHTALKAFPSETDDVCNIENEMHQKEIEIFVRLTFLNDTCRLWMLWQIRLVLAAQIFLAINTNFFHVLFADFIYSKVPTSISVRHWHECYRFIFLSLHVIINCMHLKRPLPEDGPKCFTHRIETKIARLWNHNALLTIQYTTNNCLARHLKMT